MAHGTYDVFAVLSKGRLDKHGAQGKAEVVFCVTHAELPAGKAGLENSVVTGPRPPKSLLSGR